MGGARPPPHHPPWTQSDPRAAGSGIPPTVGCSGSVSAAAMAKTARSICGALRIDEALHSMWLRPEAVQETARALRSLGFDAAGDLQLLLPSGPEQTELMEELRARGVSVADRGKIRLLLAGEVRAAGPAMSRLSPGAATESAAEAQQSPLQSSTRQLQEATGAGVSADALAIVFSVLVGAAGYLVQVRRKHGVAVIVARSQLGALVRHARVGILSSAGGALCGGTGA